MGLWRTVAEGATALYNAIYISLQSLSRRRQGDERQAIVVLSDGNDTRSLVTFEDVRELARKTDVTIYTIFLRGTEKDLKKNKYFNAKYVLERLAMLLRCQYLPEIHVSQRTSLAPA